MVKKEKSVILYDGYCNLCNAALQFIVKRDKKNIFSYHPLDAEEAKDLLPENQQINNLPDSVVLLDEGKVYVKSKALFRILPYLGKRFYLLFVFKLFPKFLLDRFYDWIASNRYAWFGKREKCVLPDNFYSNS